MKVCQYSRCGKGFEPNRAYQKYCSKPCQTYAATARWLGSGRATETLRRRDFRTGKKFLVVKMGAKKRGLPFTLTKDQYRTLTSRPCHWCGGVLPMTGGGIDRRNNLEGYTLSNSVPCCKQCNSAKNNYTVEDFLLWVGRVYKKNLREERNG
jgi:hypothetical protein